MIQYVLYYCSAVILNFLLVKLDLQLIFYRLRIEYTYIARQAYCYIHRDFYRYRIGFGIYIEDRKQIESSHVQAFRMKLLNFTTGTVSRLPSFEIQFVYIWVSSLTHNNIAWYFSFYR